MEALEIQMTDSTAVLKPDRRKFRLSEDKLVEALKNMDRGAMNSLYKMYSDSLYRVISTIVVIEEVAQDLLQETFIKIWKIYGIIEQI